MAFAYLDFTSTYYTSVSEPESESESQSDEEGQQKREEQGKKAQLSSWQGVATMRASTEASMKNMTFDYAVRNCGADKFCGGLPPSKGGGCLLSKMPSYLF